MISEKIFVLQQGFMDFVQKRYCNFQSIYLGHTNIQWISELFLDIQTLDNKTFCGYSNIGQ